MRALRAGLGRIEAVGKLRVQEPLQVRIGVATGLVVVGDLIGSQEAQERGVVGETPNLAARLHGIAAPNTVVIAEGTRRLLGDAGFSESAISYARRRCLQGQNRSGKMIIGCAVPFA